jgi:DNA-binding NarL/FixJ family response regulator
LNLKRIISINYFPKFNTENLHLNNKGVLLVDDNKTFLESAIKFLTTDTTFAVVGWAFTASEAFTKIKKFNPDLVLMDFSLPDMNGFEATRIIKQMSESTRVIILSINNHEDYIKESGLAGADGYLCKSDFGSRLLPMVESLFKPESSDADSSG